MDKKGKNSRWMMFIAMPFQMGATIYLCYLLGDWIDGKFMIDGGWWTKGLTMLGVIGSLLQFIQQANRINKNE